MSRVEPKEQEKQPPARENRPSKAEGDEHTVDEALKKQEEPKRPQD